jgi:hypothetical protein
MKRMIAYFIFLSCGGVGSRSAHVVGYGDVYFSMLRFGFRCFVFIMIDLVFFLLMIKIRRRRVFVTRF